MRSLAIVAAAGALGLSSAFLVACGDRDAGLIPADQAAAIDSELEQASADVEAEECRRAQRAVARALDQAERLPPEVDAELRQNVEEGLAHVADRVVADCGRRRTTPTTPTVTTPPVTEPPETDTQPRTQTTPTTPPSPTPPPTTPSPPPNSGGTPPGDDDGNGGGGGSPGAGGGGGQGRGGGQG